MTRPLIVVQDSRETFSPPWSPDIEVERAELECANYSVRGMTASVAYKVFWSLDDMCASLDRDRQAFDVMVRRLTAYRNRVLIVVGGTTYTEAERYVIHLALDSGLVACWPANAMGATGMMAWHFRRLARLQELN